MVLWLNNNCLFQEQLRYKSKFNFVTFDGQAIAWRENLAEINEDNLEQAESWIRDIKVKCLVWEKSENVPCVLSLLIGWTLLRNGLSSKKGSVYTRAVIWLQRSHSSNVISEYHKV